MNLRCLLILAIAGICGAVPWARAAEPLRLQEAVARAVASNPVLTAEAAELRAAEARAARTGLPPAWVAGMEVENVAGTGALRRATSAEITLRLSRVIELGGKRATRQALGTAEIARQRHDAETARLDIASRTTRRFIEVVADQQRLAFAEERVQQAERTRREVARWVKAARIPESDLSAAEITLADAELAREHAEHELASAKLTLASSWDVRQPDFEAVAGKLEELPPVESFEALAGRLPRNTTERAAQLQTDALAAERRIAVAGKKPDITLSLGARRFEALNDTGLVMSVSVPIGTRARASHAIAEADAQLDALEARRQAQRTAAHQTLFEQYQELNHARSEVDALRAKMLPKAEQALAFTRRGFDAGRFSFLQLAQAQKTLFDLRTRSVDAAARYHTLLVEVERLTAVTEPTP